MDAVVAVVVGRMGYCGDDVFLAACAGVCFGEVPFLDRDGPSS